MIETTVPEVDEDASEDPIYTNCRGYLPTGEPLDGCFDGWSWHAWRGEHIAYGPTEDAAIENLRAKETARAKELLGSPWLDGSP